MILIVSEKKFSALHFPQITEKWFSLQELLWKGNPHFTNATNFPIHNFREGNLFEIKSTEFSTSVSVTFFN